MTGASACVMLGSVASHSVPSRARSAPTRGRTLPRDTPSARADRRSNAAPMLGLQASRNPPHGSRAPAISNADHCVACTR